MEFLRSTLNLILFNIFINNWCERLEYNCACLADYERLGREVEERRKNHHTEALTV